MSSGCRYYWDDSLVRLFLYRIFVFVYGNSLYWGKNDFLYNNLCIVIILGEIIILLFNSEL
jgi:hypothetical protein